MRAFGERVDFVCCDDLIYADECSVGYKQRCYILLEKSVYVVDFPCGSRKLCYADWSSVDYSQKSVGHLCYAYYVPVGWNRMDV